MEIKWFGTASFAMKTENTKIIFDPFVPLLGSKVPIKLNDYLDYEYIFITHGHFDHIGSLKKIYKKNKKIKIYCTETPYKVLNKRGISNDNLIKIKPNDIIELCDFKIRAYQSKHIDYDPNAVMKMVTSLRSYKYLYNVPLIIYKHNVSRENGEILMFDVEVEKQRIAIMGSLNYDENVDYPNGYDLFIMPYQGKKDLLNAALEVINVLKPKCIMLSHFDNTFPPVSKKVDTLDIENALKDVIPIIKPIYKKEYEI